MQTKFQFIPHDINNMYQEFRNKDSFTRYLLMKGYMSNLWQMMVSIDPYSLSVNRYDAIYKLIHIMSNLRKLVILYIQKNPLNRLQYLEVEKYDTFLNYLHQRSSQIKSRY